MYLDLRSRDRRRSSIESVSLGAQGPFSRKPSVSKSRVWLLKRLLTVIIFFAGGFYVFFQNWQTSSYYLVLGALGLDYVPDIDIVYTFVNGTDPEWVKGKRLYTPDSVLKSTDDTNAPNRYRDNNELKYSLRSLEYYVKWARNVYIIVAMESQIPTWLNTSHPKIHIVYHRDIFTGTYSQDLPTFNSHAIETHLYKIKGLSENFIYLNDDFMFGKEIELSDFYTTHGGIKIYLSWKLNKRTKAWYEIYHTDPNALEMKPMYRISHLPHFFTRRIMREVLDIYQPEFDRTSGNRFRTPRDAQFTFLYYSYIMGDPLRKHRYEKFILSDKLQYLEVDDTVEVAEELFNIVENPSSFICLQDKGSGGVDPEEVSLAIGAALKTMYPWPSSFEKN